MGTSEINFSSPAQCCAEDVSSRSDEVAPGASTSRKPAGWALPVEARARLWLLFAALAGIKLAMVITLDEHLFKTHWRVGPRDFSWVNYAAFAALVGSAVAALVDLGHHCRAIGTGAVRAANVIILSLGLVFIFLTFHTGENNYLYPILSHTLRWSSLGPYLALDCCFRPPFLAGWIFGYALLYYVLARTGREGWTMYLTALVVGLYATLNLRELMAYTGKLFVADSLALVWFAARWGRVRMRPAWLLPPIGWTTFFTLLMLRRALPLGNQPAMDYFVLVLFAAGSLFSIGTFVARKLSFQAPWISLVPWLFTAFLLFTNANYPWAANLSKLLILAIEFPRYFMGEILVVAILFAVALLYHRILPRARFWWLDGVVFGLVFLAILDFRVSQIMGVRLGWDVLELGSSPRTIWRMSRPYLPSLLAAILVATVFYVAALRFFRSGSAGRLFPMRHRHRGDGFRFAVGCFLVLGIEGWLRAKPDKVEAQTAVSLAAPIWERLTVKRLDPADFLAAAGSLGIRRFEQAPAISGANAGRRLNVVLVFMESSFNQHLALFGSNEKTQPLLSKYKDRMELFPNFFSDFAASIQARFAAFTSLYPVRDYNAFTMRRVEVKSIFEALHDQGYKCSLFYSSYFDYTGFGDFLRGRGLDEMYDADSMPGRRITPPVSWGLREEETLSAMRAWIRQHAGGDSPFFMTYVPAAPHYPYDADPASFQKYKLNNMGDYTPAYLNELLYMDWVISSILDQLKGSGLLENTMVIITNDHGERTGAHGGPIGHGFVLTPELALTPLIILDPRHPGYRLNYTVGSQVDLLPTMLSRLGIPLPPGQLYEGLNLDSTNLPPDRVIWLNSYQQFGVVTGNHLFISDREIGRQAGLAGKFSSYTFSNEGSKTIFTEQPAGATQNFPIQRFDNFQNNLLRDYSAYAREVFETIRPTETASR